MDQNLDRPDDDYLEPDLVRLLVLEVGRLMEDVSPDLALVLPTAKRARQAKLSRLKKTVTAIAMLVDAAIAANQLGPLG